MARNRRKKNPRVVPTFITDTGTPANPVNTVKPAVVFRKGFEPRPWQDRTTWSRRRKIRGWRLGR